MNQFDINSGELIETNEAARMLQAFMTKHGINPTDPNETAIYGYAFGLNTVKEFMANIELYNKDPETKDPIIGVRAYKCLNTFEGKEIEDVFLIPITSAKYDFRPVRTSSSIPQDHALMVLDRSFPCPSICP